MYRRAPRGCFPEGEDHCYHGERGIKETGYAAANIKKLALAGRRICMRDNKAGTYGPAGMTRAYFGAMKAAAREAGGIRRRGAGRGRAADIAGKAPPHIAGIPVETRKNDIKNLRLYVKPDGRVTVSAPLTMGDEEIEEFVRRKAGWIRKQIARFENLERQAPREYVSGETLYVWGKPYRLRREHGSKYALVLSGDEAVLTARRESTAAQRGRFVREWYRGLLKTEIGRLLPKWERITGLKAAGWQTKYMTTRWGTCNTGTGRIWINPQLAGKPPECLEYILLHELIHLREKNHGAGFVTLMDRYMPAWREVRATLNDRTFDPADRRAGRIGSAAGQMGGRDGEKEKT